MPITQNNLREFFGPLFAPGRRIYVNASTGSDTTGSGSIAAPYATIDRGFQDVRDGAGDVLIPIGTFTLSSPVVLSGKDRWIYDGSQALMVLTGHDGQMVVDWVYRHQAFGLHQPKEMTCETTATHTYAGAAAIPTNVITVNSAYVENSANDLAMNGVYLLKAASQAQMTAATSLQLTASTIVRTTGSWVTDGFLDGDVVALSSFGVGGNNGLEVLISAVAATTLTFRTNGLDAASVTAEGPTVGASADGTQKHLTLLTDWDQRIGKGNPTPGSNNDPDPLTPIDSGVVTNVSYTASTGVFNRTDGGSWITDGFTVGMNIQLDEAWPSAARGAHFRVSAVTAADMTVDTDLMDAPLYTGSIGGVAERITSAKGKIAAYGLVIHDCSDVIVYGLSMGASSKTWTGIALRAGGDPVQPTGGRDIRIVGCNFTNAGIAAQLGVESSTDLVNQLSGKGVRLETCRFRRNFTNLIFREISGIPHLGFIAGVDIISQGCTFDFGGILFAGAACDGAVRHYSGTPPGEVLVYDNIFKTDSSLDALTGSLTPGYSERSFFFTDRNQDLSGKYSFTRNRFPGVAIAGGGLVISDGEKTGDPLRDDAPATFLNESQLQTQPDLIWRNLVLDAIDVPGSMGELVAKLSYESSIHIDTVAGTSGQQVGVNGTPSNPVDNLTDARALADALGFQEYHLHGPLTVNTDHLDWIFAGIDPETDIVTIVSGTDVSGSRFTFATIRGDLTGSISAQDSIIGGPALTVTGLQGTFNTVGMSGTIVLADGGTVQGFDLASQSIAGTTINYANAASITAFLCANLVGLWTVENMTVGNSIFGAAVNGSEITLDSSVTAGIVRLGGVGELIDNSTSLTALFDDLVKGSDVQETHDNVEATSEIIQTTDPWRERWIRQSDGATLAEFELYDETLVAVNNSNPIQGKYVRRRLKL